MLYYMGYASLLLLVMELQEDSEIEEIFSANLFKGASESPGHTVLLLKKPLDHFFRCRKFFLQISYNICGEMPSLLRFAVHFQ